MQGQKIWDMLFSVVSHRPYRRAFVFAAKTGDVIKSEIYGAYVDGRLTIADSADRLVVEEDGIYIVYATNAVSETATIVCTLTYKTLNKDQVRALGEVHYGSYKGTV
jgi:hypothetical protein